MLGDVGAKIQRRVRKLLYFFRTGYLPDGERVIPDFPDENFQNHFKVYKFLRQFAAGMDVLDSGCGTGYGTAYLSEVAKSIIGVDLSSAALKWAHKHYPNVKYIQMDVQNLQFPDSSFDLIVSSENFEHLPDQKAHVAELARVLRHGGLCIVASPNPEMTIGVHNRFHTKENTYAELLDLFSKYFGEVSIIENSLEPPTSTGRDQRTERWLKGQKGSMVPPGVDTTWLHNTHSFFCFLLQPLKQ